MSKLYNRTPVSFNTPASNAAKYFNYVDWKGIDENKNIFTVDQQSFEDCKNVYIDDDGILKSRPKLRPVNNVKNIVDFWTFNDIVVYQFMEREGYAISIEHNSYTTKILTFSKSVLIKEIDDKLVFFSNFGGNSYIKYYDKNEHDFKDGVDLLYVPNTTVYSETVQKDLEENNLLTTSENTVFLYTPMTGISPQAYLVSPLTYTIKTPYDKFKMSIDTKYGTLDKRIVDYMYDLDTEVFDVSPCDQIVSINKNSVRYSQDGYNFILDYTLDYDSILDHFFAVGSKSTGYEYRFSTRKGDTVTNYRIYNDGTIEFSNHIAWNIGGHEYIGDYVDMRFDLDNSINISNIFITRTKYYQTQPDSNDFTGSERRIQITVYAGTKTYKFIDNTDIKDTVYIFSQTGEDTLAVTTFKKNMEQGVIYYLYTRILSLTSNYQTAIKTDSSTGAIGSTSLYGSNFTGYTFNKIFRVRDYDDYDVLLGVLDIENVSNIYEYSLGLDVGVYSAAVSDDYILTRKSNTPYLYNFVKFLPIPLPNESIFRLRLGENAYILTNNSRDTKSIYTNNFNNVMELTYTSVGVQNPLLTSCKISSTLNEHYFAVDNTLYITQKIMEDEEFKLYLPESNKQIFDKRIIALHPISDTQMGVFTEDGIWYIEPTESGYTYYKSKLNLSLKSGIIVSTDGTGSSTLLADKYGLLGLNYQSFMSTSEQVLSYLSTPVLSKFKSGEVNKILVYKTYILCYSGNDSKLYILDVRNMSWWYWDLTKSFRKILILKGDTYDYKLGILFNDTNQLYTFDNDTSDYFDLVGDDNIKIDWFITSQKLHLDAINYRKYIYSIIFNTSKEGDGGVYHSLKVTNYRDFVEKRQAENLEYEVDTIRTFVKKLNCSKVNEFQFTLLSKENPLNLSNISIRYVVNSEVR